MLNLCLKRYNMAMVRPKGKGQKIAFNILGKPANLAFKPSPKQKAIEKRLLFEETKRSR